MLPGAGRWMPIGGSRGEAHAEPGDAVVKVAAQIRAQHGTVWPWLATSTSTAPLRQAWWEVPRFDRDDEMVAWVGSQLDAAVDGEAAAMVASHDRFVRSFDAWLTTLQP